MKKILSTLFSTLQRGARGGLLFIAFIATPALWSQTEVNGIFYNILEDYNLEVTMGYEMNYWGEVYLKMYSGSVTIPEHVLIDGTIYNVTAIGREAFWSCSDLTSVTIPNSVTSIGEDAFSGCSGLTTVTISESAKLKSIGSYAFAGCSGLTSITIPNSVTSIGSHAFISCSSLTSVTIPNSVTSIGEGAFGDCSGLTSITIPNSVTSIEYGAFANCSSLTSITIPNSVTSIGNYAFNSCSGLTSITIPNSVTSIGEYAFAGCSGLTSVVVEEGNIVYDSRENCNAIIETATNTLITGCQNTTIPNNVAKIEDYAFQYCSNLTSITIPNSVTSIGSYAFSDCSGLTSITIPNSVTSIGGGAFYGCSGNLTKFVCYNSSDYLLNTFKLYDNPLLDTVAAPAAFFDISENNWAVSPKNIKYVEVLEGELTDDAFGFINRSYKTLKVLDLAGATNTTIADEAFKGCYNLDSLYLPAQLQYIPYMAVADCKMLQSITIPASVEEIDHSAFENCRSLKSVTFEGGEAPQGGANYAAAEGSSLWRIGSWAFYNCHQLEHLTIPEGVTTIGDAAFYGCTYLQDMTLPSTIQEIGDNGFALCAKLQKIHSRATTPPAIQAKTFFDVNRQIPVYVPAKAVESYKDDPYWQEFDILGDSNAPTALENTQYSTTDHRKLLRNGQLIIIREGKTYNTLGAIIN